MEAVTSGSHAADPAAASAAVNFFLAAALFASAFASRRSDFARMTDLSSSPSRRRFLPRFFYSLIMPLFTLLERRFLLLSLVSAMNLFLVLLAVRCTG